MNVLFETVFPLMEQQSACFVCALFVLGAILFGAGINNEQAAGSIMCPIGLLLIGWTLTSFWVKGWLGSCGCPGPVPELFVEDGGCGPHSGGCCGCCAGAGGCCADCVEDSNIRRWREENKKARRINRHVVRPKDFYHATTEENALRIQEHGFKIPPGPGGLLGRGVYCTTTWAKAMDYLKGPCGGVVLVLRIEDLGKCKILEIGDPMMTTWQDAGYDSAWAPFSAVNPHDKGKQENCVKDPKRIKVIDVIAGDEDRLRRGGYNIIDGKLTR